MRLAAGREAVRVARENGLRDVQAVALNDLARAIMTHGLIADATPPLDEAIALLRQLGDKPMLADALGARAVAALGDQDLQTALASTAEARALADEIHNDWSRSFADMNGGRAWAETGDLGAGIELYGSCVAYGDRAGFMLAQVGIRAELAKLYWEAGDHRVRRSTCTHHSASPRKTGRSWCSGPPVRVCGSRSRAGIPRRPRTGSRRFGGTNPGWSRRRRTSGR